MADKHRYSDEQKDRNTLKSLYLLSNNYHETTRDFEVLSGIKLHPSMVRMLIKGYNPGKKIRKLLNWCPLSLAPACLRCGGVHTTKRCTAQPRHYRDLFSMPSSALRRLLEERRE